MSADQTEPPVIPALNRPFDGYKTRRDGQRVGYWITPGETDPDLYERCEAFPAGCGCYPRNTDWREYVCPHGARWTRSAFEPYGRPENPSGPRLLKPAPGLAVRVTPLNHEENDQ